MDMFDFFVLATKKTWQFLLTWFLWSIIWKFHSDFFCKICWSNNNLQQSSKACWRNYLSEPIPSYLDPELPYHMVVASTKGSGFQCKLAHKVGWPQWKVVMRAFSVRFIMVYPMNPYGFVSKSEGPISPNFLISSWFLIGDYELFAVLNDENENPYRS